MTHEEFVREVLGKPIDALTERKAGVVTVAAPPLPSASDLAWRSEVPPVMPKPAPTRGIFRVGEITFWSTLALCRAQNVSNTSFHLFSTALGQQGQNFNRALSISETNMKEAGRIPSGQSFEVRSIHTDMLSRDVDRVVVSPLLQHAVLRWNFMQTCIDIGPADLTHTYHHYPVVLPANTTFTVNLDFGSATPIVQADCAIRVLLFGSYQTAIGIG